MGWVWYILVGNREGCSPDAVGSDRDKLKKDGLSEQPVSWRRARVRACVQNNTPSYHFDSATRPNKEACK